MGRGRPAVAVLSRPLAELRPKWVYEQGETRIATGLEFDCPRCAWIPNGPEHRLRLWFIGRKGDETTIGGEVLRLHDHVGTRFEDLTVWTERPKRDPLIQAAHWVGYLERGTIYEVLRFSAC